MTLRDITMDNFIQCIKLAVSEEQNGFVASNVYSLAEAKADSVSIPLAIYDDDLMVGFIMYDFEPEEDRGYVTRLMVDARFQGQGYGRSALEEVVARLKAISGCLEIQTSYVPANRRVEKLYASLGFEQTGEEEDGEIVVRMEVVPGQMP